MNDLVRYDAMCRAIADCHAVDEALEIKDKARALEIYAMQVKNTDAERKACDVRLRAERRVGELLRELQRATPSDAATVRHHGQDALPTGRNAYTQALTEHGISTQSASRYQRLADVPSDEFEAVLAGDAKPSTTRILAEATTGPAPKLDDDALWIWGRARDFERAHFPDREPAELLACMTPTMRADMRRIAPQMAHYFDAIEELTR
jgi:hypothetical protein